MPTPAVRFALLVMPAFSNAVIHVVFGCAKKKMIQAHARRCVAAMKDVQVIWNGAMSQLPCDTMSDASEALLSADQPIAFTTSSARPKPTAFALFHFLPETLVQWTGKAGYQLFSLKTPT